MELSPGSRESKGTRESCKLSTPGRAYADLPAVSPMYLAVYGVIPPSRRVRAVKCRDVVEKRKKGEKKDGMNGQKNNRKGQDMNPF